MNGSLFFWGWMLTLFGAVVSIWRQNYPRKLFSWALPIHLIAQFFFLTVTLFFTNPFEFIKADFIPPDGNGLNPLLQNPYMAVHPPMLYLGFTLFSIPYAFCMAALVSRELSNEWIHVTRRWTLVAWAILTAGIVMGGFWAYIELGWGGFWAWDPVENSSFLPWLTGTAFLHSSIVQERKGMLKSWNITLIGLTYGLTVFGTFLTRSGIVQSVHAFASTEIGGVFLIYLGFLALFITTFLFLRRKDLKAEKTLESVLSREAAFLLNNLIFLSICFATVWGVMFPVLSEAITGEKQTIGIPFFNAVNIPLFLLMLLLMGVGTLIAWRKASWKSIRNTFLTPFIASLLLGALLVWAGITSFYPLLSYCLCFFVFLTIMGEYHRGVKALRASNPKESFLQTGAKLVRRNSRRYGGYIVHLGVVIVSVAITASMAHKIEKEFSLAKGESFEIGRFSLKLNDLYGAKNNNYEALIADVSLIRRNDKHEIAKLHPEMRMYTRKSETTSEIALRVGPREDVYLVLAGLSQDETKASFKIFINPLQMWLWVGAVIMVLGTGVIIIPELFARKRLPIPQDAVTV